jgi:hypothetical protein
VHPRLLLVVCVLHEGDLGSSFDPLDLGKLDEIVDALPLVLQVEAGVLEAEGEVDDGLTNVLNLFLRGDLLPSVD